MPFSESVVRWPISVSDVVSCAPSETRFSHVMGVVVVLMVMERR